MTTPNPSTDRAIERVHAALLAAGCQQIKRRGGTHIKSTCPAHPDPSPSLGIDQRGDRVVLRCYAGCAAEDVVAALGLTMADLWDEPPGPCAQCGKPAIPNPSHGGERIHDYCAAKRDGRPVTRTPRPEPKRAAKVGPLPPRFATRKKPAKKLDEPRTTATYEHTDADGTVIAQSVRQEWTEETPNGTRTAKTFFQQYAGKRGDWIKTKPAGLQVPLWRLPEISEAIAAGTPIYLTEGHKDAQAILEAGGEATTNINGAANFSTADAQQLAGATVFVVMDRDLAGYGRGLDVHAKLAEVAASTTLCLPAIETPKADAYDHLQTRELDDLAHVTVDDVRTLHRIAKACADLQVVTDADAEARLWLGKDNRGKAGRWAIEAGRKLAAAYGLLVELLEHPGRTTQVEELIDQVQQGRTTYAQLIADTGAEVEDDAQTVLDADLDPSPPDATVVDLPYGRTSGEPAHPVPTSGRWKVRYDAGENCQRGLYVWTSEGREGAGYWQRVADLPYVLQRITRRDGADRPIGTDYLLSDLPEDGTTVLANTDMVRDCSWANRLDMDVPDDPKIQQALATAVRMVARATAPTVEALPRVVDGRVSIPVPETLPPGYLMCAPGSREDGLAAWADIIATVSDAPTLALTLGASAIGPFVGAMGEQSHWVALYGDPNQGKTVTLKAAAGIWGDSIHPNRVVRPWNTSATGLTRFAGELALFSPFLDEIGQASIVGPDAWGKLIFDMAQGASRNIADRRSASGTIQSHPWSGICFVSGNGRLTDGLGAGRHAGIPKRVIDLAGPFTSSKEQADELTRVLLPRAYGHAGLALLEAFDVDAVRALHAQAAQIIREPDDGAAITIARSLQLHITGAMMLDQIAGTGRQLTDAVIGAAVAHFEAWSEPQHDADRALAWVRDAIGRQPLAWPTKERYATGEVPNGDLGGIRTPAEAEEPYTAVFSHTWKQMCSAEGIDSAIACRELHRRGALYVPHKQRSKGEWTWRSRDTGANMYKILQRFLDEDPDHGDDAPLTDPEPTTQPPMDTLDQDDPVRGDTEPVRGPVRGDVRGANAALTRGVRGVRGPAADDLHVPTRDTRDAHGTPANSSPIEVDASRPTGEWADNSGRTWTRQWATTSGPCEVCGRPCIIVLDGHRVHPPCADLMGSGDTGGITQQAPSAPEPQPAPRATEPQAAPAARGTSPRFAAPAAVVDEEIHLPGSTTPWPDPVDHLGDLAVLAHRDRLALGHGGGKDRLPDLGQVWLTAAALERLGLPAAITWPEVGDRAKHLHSVLADYADKPAVAAARAAGWELDRLDSWTKIRHPEHLPHGAWLVALPWQRIDGVALLDGNPAPAELAKRLKDFADALHVAYRLTPAATGLDLVDHTRPPRRDAHDTIGMDKNRRSVIRNEPAELPPFLRDTRDGRFHGTDSEVNHPSLALTGLEGDFQWWRTWDKAAGHHALTDSERDATYVHVFDRGRSYAAPWSSIELGVDGLTHHLGDDAAWDGKEHPGIYRVRRWEWTDWGLPDPANALSARTEDDQVWCTVHTLRQLAAHGIEPEVTEAYRWTTHTRYLEPAAKILRAALDHPDPAVAKTAKNVFRTAVGKLGQVEHNPNYHLWRPDWRAHIIAHTRTAILHTLTQIRDASGALPLLVDRDQIAYASPHADPREAWDALWPDKGASKWGRGIGQWKPVGTAPMGTWGPKHLQGRVAKRFGNTIVPMGGWNWALAKADLEPYNGTL